MKAIDELIVISETYCKEMRAANKKFETNCDLECKYHNQMFDMIGKFCAEIEDVLEELKKRRPNE